MATSIAIPAVIDHKNIGPLLRALLEEPYFRIGSVSRYDPDAWYWRTVILEVPTGELARDGLATLAIAGVGADVEHAALTGREGFAAQGLEGKARIRKPLFNALMNLRDLIAPYRGRIVQK